MTRYRSRPRIGPGTPFMVWGFVAIGLALFVLLISGGHPLPIGLASLLGLFGSGLVMVGFWKGLAHNIELRLMDIEAAVRGAADVPPEPDISAAPESY